MTEEKSEIQELREYVDFHNEQTTRSVNHVLERLGRIESAVDELYFILMESRLLQNHIGTRGSKGDEHLKNLLRYRNQG